MDIWSDPKDRPPPTLVERETSKNIFDRISSLPWKTRVLISLGLTLLLVLSGIIVFYFNRIDVDESDLRLIFEERFDADMYRGENPDLKNSESNLQSSISSQKSRKIIPLEKNPRISPEVKRRCLEMAGKVDSGDSGELAGGEYWLKSYSIEREFNINGSFAISFDIMLNNAELFKYANAGIGDFLNCGSRGNVNIGYKKDSQSSSNIIVAFYRKNDGNFFLFGAMKEFSLKPNTWHTVKIFIIENSGDNFYEIIDINGRRIKRKVICGPIRKALDYGKVLIRIESGSGRIWLDDFRVYRIK